MDYHTTLQAAGIGLWRVANLQGMGQMRQGESPSYPLVVEWLVMGLRELMGFQASWAFLSWLTLGQLLIGDSNAELGGAEEG